MRAAIQDGILRAGAQLPTIRDLAVALRVNRNTVSSAYARLVTAGFVATDGRRGTRVADRSTDAVVALARQGIVDLSSGNPDSLLLPPLEVPEDRSQRRVLYDMPEEMPELAEWARGSLSEDGVPAADIAFTNGAFDALRHLLMEFRDGRKQLAVEDPCFFPTLKLARELCIETVGIRTDQYGIDPDDLARVLAEGCGAVLLTPYALNPTGASWTAQRAREIAQVLGRFPDVLAIEDDYFGPLAVGPRLHVVSGRTGRWAVVRSVSKYFGPDFRFAFLAGDAESVRRLRMARNVSTRWVSYLTQRCVLSAVTSRTTQALMLRARESYERRRRSAMAALQREGVLAMGDAGFHLWVPVPDEMAVVQGLMMRGWAVRPGGLFRLTAESAVRVTVSTLTDDQAASFARDLRETLATDSSRARP